MKRSKDYVRGFKHGIDWTRIYMTALINEDPDWEEIEFEDDVKEAIKSLKEGR